MNDDNPQSGPKSSSTNSSLHLFISTAGFIGILLLAGYVGSQFQDIEDKLQHNPPVSHTYTNGAINFDKGQTVYVPAYSHIYTGSGEPQLLAITLSIRNTDPDNSIKVIEGRYFDTKGQLVKNYVDGVVEIAPLETVELLVGRQDKKGGSGANFIITWKADQPVYEPIIEAIMIGSDENGISFISPARPLAERVSN